MRSPLICTLLLPLLLGACSGYSDPESELAAAVAAMETALDERDKSGFMAHLSQSFIGRGRNGGALDRDEAEKMLTLYFLRYRRVGVLVTQLQIEIDLYEPGLATTQATVALTGGEQLLPNSAGLYQVSGQWQNYDGEWKLTQMNWE